MTVTANPLETAEQKAFVRWLEAMGLKFTAIPNETGHTPEAKRRAIRMKQLGVRKGFPDVIVIIPPNRSIDGLGHFLAIEMKRVRDSYPTPEQKAWIAAINDLDTPTCMAGVCRGADEAIQLATSYLNPERASKPVSQQTNMLASGEEF